MGRSQRYSAKLVKLSTKIIHPWFYLLWSKSVIPWNLQVKTSSPLWWGSEVWHLKGDQTMKSKHSSEVALIVQSWERTPTPPKSDDIIGRCHILFSRQFLIRCYVWVTFLFSHTFFNYLRGFDTWIVHFYIIFILSSLLKLLPDTFQLILKFMTSLIVM